MNPQEQLMRKIQQHQFAAKDLQLYLDTHPTDRNALMLFNQHTSQLRMLKDNYVKNFGMLEEYDVSDKFPFSWVVNPWPWMMKNMLREEEEEE